jgi:hypothetical protein
MLYLTTYNARVVVVNGVVVRFVPAYGVLCFQVRRHNLFLKMGQIVDHLFDKRLAPSYIVARFVLIQHTKRGKTIPNYHQIYKI